MRRKADEEQQMMTMSESGGRPVRVKLTADVGAYLEAMHSAEQRGEDGDRA